MELNAVATAQSVHTQNEQILKTNTVNARLN